MNKDPLNYRQSPFYYSEDSPMKFIGGIIQGVGGLIGRKSKKAARDAAKDQMEADMEAYRNLDTSNPYENLENTAEDLTVNTQEAEFQRDAMQQQQANMMGSMEQAGSFDAGNIQAMMGAASQSARQASASIGAQESANQKMAAQQASANQMAKAQGESQKQQREADKQATLLGMSQEQFGAAQGAVDQSTADMVGGFGSALGGVASLAMSDRRLKKNIKKVGESPSGLNIYNFEYKDKKRGTGTYQGVMADEVPSKAVIKNGKYNMVDYNAIDVVSKKVKK